MRRFKVIRILVFTLFVIPALVAAFNSFVYEISNIYFFIIYSITGLSSIVVFIYNERKSAKKDLNIIQNFNPDLSAHLSDYGKIVKNKTYIFAQSGAQYKSLLKDSKCHFLDLSVFLKDPKTPSVLVIEPNAFKNAFEDSFRWFKAYNQKGSPDYYVEDLKIYKYPFDSFLFFMVIDKTLAHFGLLRPNPNHNHGCELVESTLVKYDTPEAQKIVDNLFAQSQALESHSKTQLIYPDDR